MQAGHWLAEESYEWGNPENKFVSSRPEDTEYKLSTAARRWRLQGGGAFEGMKFIVHVPENKGGSYKR